MLFIDRLSDRNNGIMQLLFNQSTLDVPYRFGTSTFSPFQTGNLFWGHISINPVALRKGKTLLVLAILSAIGLNSAGLVQTLQKVASYQALHCLLAGISMQNPVKIKHPPETP